MAVRSRLVYIAACDIPGCNAVFGEDPEFAYHFDTAEAATAWVEGGNGWTVDGDRLICPADDRVHDRARIPQVAL